MPLILICITFAELLGSWRLGRLKKEGIIGYVLWINAIFIQDNMTRV
jgi:hypothetical protein